MQGDRDLQNEPIFPETAARKEKIAIKTKEELNALKQKAEALNAKFSELTDEEAAAVFGGFDEQFIGKFLLAAGLSSSIDIKLKKSVEDLETISDHRGADKLSK